MRSETTVSAVRRRVLEQAGSLLFEATAERAGEARSLVFEKPQEVVEAWRPEEMDGVLGRLEAALAAGRWVAGYVSYEGACALLRAPRAVAEEERLAWFGVYEGPQELKAERAKGVGEGRKFPLCLEMELAPAAYREKVGRVQAWLAEGQSYQMNLTTAVGCGWRGDDAELYEALVEAQPSPYTALLHPEAGERVMSFSPELLFRIEKGERLVTRPMKGTARREQGRGWLERDEKNRAEHVMIVDLLRNDLGRVCEAGSVEVERMFAVEEYRTLLQMTSTVAGRLRAGVGLGDVLRTMLPAGSMTGAPKRRTVELLGEVEEQPRGVYSGAIGFAGPDGTAVFSVPIRTVAVKDERLRMGVGGGVVADSEPEEELAECWLKARFLTEVGERFDLVETLQWDGSGYCWLREHMDRIEPSAGLVGYRFDRAEVVRRLEEFGRGLQEKRRVRLMLAQDGALRLEDSELRVWRHPVHADTAEESIWSGDTFLRHKTTFRPVYDTRLERALAEGFQDVLFLNERGEYSEGAITSLVVRLDGAWVTPAASAGLLPGVARGIVLRSGQVTERVLTEDDVRRAEAVVLVNGVRGVAQVRQLRMRGGEVLEWEEYRALPSLPEGL